MSEEHTCEMFSEHLGSVFRAPLESGEPLALELIEAKQAKHPTKAGLREPFTLLFRGPNEPVMPQQLVPLKHDSMGDLAVFLVPIGPDEEGMLYEAVFN